MADTTLRPFAPFRDFVNSINVATHDGARAMAASKVANADNFEAMRQHIAGLYEGVEVTHSFADANGQVFDCVPIEHQPALRRAGLRAAPVPPIVPGNPSGNLVADHEPHVDAQINPKTKDVFGNTTSCPPGTIPMRRITLEELSRFESLDHFFRKSPLGRGRHPRLSAPQTGALAHKYAHAYQVVPNLGGHNFLNVWQPSVVGPDQVFSLAQHWYAGGSGSNLQTVEVGWQVYPQKYGTSQPVLFIYWTADDYTSTGCYNLDCHAFVQTNPSWTIGGALSPVSTAGGTQYDLEVAFYLSGGNWWLYLKGTAVGYYPGSIFRGGQLATNAGNIDYGGETVASTNYPSMGSGAFASAGWQKAAYHRDIFFFPTTGGAQHADLIPSQPSPSCYTLSLFSSTPPWNRYFYFGGPGGTSC